MLSDISYHWLFAWLEQNDMVRRGSINGGINWARVNGHPAKNYYAF